jgi:hypothetical protein
MEAPTASEAPKRPGLTLYLLPMEVDVEGATVTILESAKLNLPWTEYQAAVQVRLGEVTTNVFHVSYRDGKELARKLAAEVSKLKYALFLYGKEELRRRGIVR